MSHLRKFPTIFNLRQKTYKGLSKHTSLARHISGIEVKHNTSSWRSYIKRWKWSLSIGFGVTTLAIVRWKYFESRAEVIKVNGRFNNFIVKCYCCLPLRITSRIWGWIANIQLPVGLRPTVYGFYAKTFCANLGECDSELSTFPSLAEFFVRSLKQDARPIARNTNIVSPADGTVLFYGPVTSYRVEQIKGVTYNLQHFLGPMNQSDKFTRIDDDEYINTLLKNPTNRLYQLTVYLAPGDYHRFHSPADWIIDFRRHFQGKLLSVNPRIASLLPDLFSLNERVVYIGKWAGGFMAYAAVGATNVGSIRVYCDKELITNERKWPKTKLWEDHKFKEERANKGDLFGEFRMGSTIVLLFEAPEDFQLSLKPGQIIKMGEALTEGIVNR